MQMAWLKNGFADAPRPAGGRRWFLLATALVLLSVSGCASGTVGSNRSPAQAGTTALTSSPSDPDMPSDPLPGRVVVIGLTQNGKAVTVRTGQRIAVVLAANWTPPQASPAAGGASAGMQPLRTDSAQGYPAPVAGEARFTAVRAGTAVVTAHTDFGCLHTTPRCLPPQQSFTVTVLVRPGPGAGTGPFDTPGASEPPPAAPVRH